MSEKPEKPVPVGVRMVANLNFAMHNLAALLGYAVETKVENGARSSEVMMVDPSFHETIMAGLLRVEIAVKQVHFAIETGAIQMPLQKPMPMEKPHEQSPG